MNVEVFVRTADTTRGRYTLATLILEAVTLKRNGNVKLICAKAKILLW